MVAVKQPKKNFFFFKRDDDKRPNNNSNNNDKNLNKTEPRYVCLNQSRQFDLNAGAHSAYVFVSSSIGLCYFSLFFLCRLVTRLSVHQTSSFSCFSISTYAAFSRERGYKKRETNLSERQFKQCVYSIDRWCLMHVYTFVRLLRGSVSVFIML